MKIDPTTFKAIHNLMTPLDTEPIRTAYRAGRFPNADGVRDLDKRYRWDLFYAARAYTVLPEGLTDAHVDTALRRIVPTLKEQTR